MNSNLRKLCPQISGGIPYNPLVRYTSLLSTCSSVRRIFLLSLTHPLLGGCTLQRSTSRYTGNVQFEASEVLHENGNHGRTVDSRYVAHHLASLSPKQHSVIRVVRIIHVGTKRKPLTEAGSPNILVHVVTIYDAFQAVFGFLSLTFTLALTHVPHIRE